ncbi:hypothetical protein GGI02_000755 [Coemansia sp. RSA 2322]|nr:hypothetical protein GGI02_000755 [Coemansia sp. RSA 2322]
MSSLVSSAQSDMPLPSAKSAEGECEDDMDATSIACMASAVGSAIPVASHSASTSEELDSGGDFYKADDFKAGKSKAKDKDRGGEKASRRQSIKNQRSLPAMFGISLKAKSENKPVPPVPQLPTAEGANGSNLGRRLLGALRSNSSNEPPLSKGAGAVMSTNNNSRRTASQSIESGVGVDSLPQAEMPVAAEESFGASPSSANNDVDIVAAASTEDIVIVGAHLNAAAPRASVDIDAPPLTPLKDSPPGLFKVTSSAAAASSTQTLTREQKRQSNAAHRLAGLFKRKPSIPEVLPSGIQAYPKLGLETSKASHAVPGATQQQQQQPLPASAARHILPKDRRLSTSASTPNLIEAAAAAASSDQPALAVYAATERGNIPPMPAPPTLRPSISSVASPPGLANEFTVANGVGESKQLDRLRKTRGDSFSDAALSSNSSQLRIDERRLMQQTQQANATTRPSLKISTRSAVEVLTYMPEHISLPVVPLTAGVDGSAVRSRKSSTATAVESQSIISRAGSTSHSHAVASGGGDGAPSGQMSYRRPSLIDIEEDQRLDMFEPFFGTFHQDLGPAPPKSSPMSSLWFIGTLHRSMVSGGAHLTPSLFIPRRLWHQTGIRIAAIDTKLGVLTQLTQSFMSVSSLVSLPDIDTLLMSLAPGSGNMEEGDRRRVEAAPWESEDVRGKGSSTERDTFHKSCVAMHHWLNNLEESLDSNRRLLSKKLKFVSPSATWSTGVPANGGAGAALPLATLSSQSAVVAHAVTSSDSLQSSTAHLPSFVTAGGSHDSHRQLSNASFPSLSLSNGDIPGSHQLAPISPLSPAAELPEPTRISDVRLAEVAGSATVGGSGSLAASAGREQLSKDQMANARFKGFGKLGKSVDRLYSNIQKEKLDDTSAYVAALQRMFEAAMVLETLLQYFSRIASDADMAGWFSDVPQSPVSLAGRRPPLGRSTAEQGGRGAASGSPLIAQATLASEPSVSSLGSMAALTTAGRKLSNASISAAGASADKKNRRRSNYFGQRQNSGSGFGDSTDNIPGAAIGRATSKPRGESFSVVPRLVPSMSNAGGPTAAHGLNNGHNGGRFVLPQSPIKNPMSFVQQGKGRAPGVIYARLVKIAEWLNQVLLAWVVRDLQVLFAKYIKRLREWVIE